MGKRWAAGFMTVILGGIFGLVIVGPPGNDAPAPLLRADGNDVAGATTTVVTTPAAEDVTTTSTQPPGGRQQTTTTRATAEAPPFPGKPLKLGSSGSDVRAWQAQMRKRGWSIATDGQYGRSAADVCEAFQRQKGLNPTGEVDQATWVATWTAPLPDETKPTGGGS